MAKNKKRNGKNGIAPTPAVSGDSKKAQGGAPEAGGASVKEAKDWVDFNKK